MTKIFVSSLQAHKSHSAALVAELKGERFMVGHSPRPPLDEPYQPWTSWYSDNCQEELDEADIFVIVVSQYWEVSPWMQHECIEARRRLLSGRIKQIFYYNPEDIQVHGLAPRDYLKYRLPNSLDQAVATLRQFELDYFYGAAPVKSQVLESPALDRIRHSWTCSEESLENWIPPLLYGGFWRRLGALAIDGLVFLLFITIVSIGGSSPIFALMGLLAYYFSPHVYEIALHTMCGQTLGKMALGLKVVSVNGQPISWEQAVLRNSVPMGFSALMTLPALLAIFGSAPAPIHTEPVLSSLVGIGYCLWLGAEIVTLLANDKRQAIHDLMAETTVVRIGRKSGRGYS